MRTRPMPISACSASRSFRTSACTVTSRAVVGSSAMMMSGFIASAMAIMTRWRWPPENWCGYLSSDGVGVGDADAAHQVEGALGGLGRG